MVNYQLGKVYKIVGNGLIYVGSTTRQLLCQRLAGHNRDFRRFQNGTLNGGLTSFKCLTDKNHYIELLELFPCGSKDELHACERKWIEQLDCVNKMIPLRTYKEYYEDNKEKLLEDKKQYYIDNKDKIKLYQQDNKEKIAEQKRQYWQDNRDKIYEQKRNRRKAKKAITA
jgi:hypothetical protein